MNDLLKQLIMELGEAPYTINYYGDGKLIHDVICDELPLLINVNACFEEVAEYYYTKCNSVEAQVVDNKTKKVITKYRLQ